MWGKFRNLETLLQACREKVYLNSGSQGTESLWMSYWILGGKGLWMVLEKVLSL